VCAVLVLLCVREHVCVFSEDAGSGHVGALCVNVSVRGERERECV